MGAVDKRWKDLIEKTRRKQDRTRYNVGVKRRWRLRCPQCALPKHQGVCIYSPWRWNA